MDERENQHNTEMEGMIGGEENVRTPDPPRRGTEHVVSTDSSLIGSMVVVFNDLAAAARDDGSGVDDSGRPAGMAPAYRDGEAQRQAEEQEGAEFDDEPRRQEPLWAGSDDDDE